MAKKKYIYIRELKVKVEVSEEIFKEYCHFSDYEKNLRKKDKKNGRLLYSNLDNGRVRGEEMITDQNQISTEEQVELKLMIEKLRVCLDLLSEEERRLIKELFYNKLSERELSRKTGIHNMTIHNRKVRVLEKLKKLLEK